MKTKGLMAPACRKLMASEGNWASNLSQAGSPDWRLTVLASVSVSAAPALVTPLLNLSTQIQPPSKMWCTAASSTGYGGLRPSTEKLSGNGATFLKCEKRA